MQIKNGLLASPNAADLICRREAEAFESYSKAFRLVKQLLALEIIKKSNVYNIVTFFQPSPPFFFPLCLKRSTQLIHRLDKPLIHAPQETAHTTAVIHPDYRSRQWHLPSCFSGCEQRGEYWRQNKGYRRILG